MKQIRDCALMDSESVSNALLRRLTNYSFVAYFGHLLHRKLLLVSASVPSVTHIICVTAEPQMTHTHTSRGIAIMEYIHSIRNGSAFQYPGYSMSQPMRRHFETPISANFSSSPDPAFSVWSMARGFINKSLKALSKWQGFRHHSLDAATLRLVS